jgi:maleylpyruvate isomerase
VEILTALRGVRTSTDDLLAALNAGRWSSAAVAEPSLCAGWTRGHVLTHLARNADGISETLAGALRGEIIERYPDGWESRNAAISAGARRRFAELVADVDDSAQRLDRMFCAVADADGWELETEKGHPAKHWLDARWKEVEIHRVDLAAGYTPDRWPPAMVAAMFEREIERLGERARGAVRVGVTERGSLLRDFAGREWHVGEGPAVEVVGPDWAVLAWLVGRPSVVADVLTATPELGPYN